MTIGHAITLVIMLLVNAMWVAWGLYVLRRWRAAIDRYAKARAEIERLKAEVSEYEERADEFNRGYEAALAGKPYEEPHDTRHDEWRVGYAWATRERLQATNAELLAACEAFRDWEEERPGYLPRVQVAKRIRDAIAKAK